MKGDGPANRQVRLPSAPRIDETGLHHLDCECARCALGFRPTRLERDRQRFLCERAAAARAKAKADAAKVSKEEEKSALTWERLAEQEKATIERIAAVTRPVQRPATPEELAELKAEFGFGPRRKVRR
jgi:hypothetical protein